MTREPLYQLLLVGYTEGRRIAAIRGVREIFDHTLLGAKLVTERLPYLLAEGLTLAECERLAGEMAQNEAMTEILPDETSAGHNDAFSEVICPCCGFAGLKILHVWGDVPPEWRSRPIHICQACHERFEQ